MQAPSRLVARAGEGMVSSSPGAFPSLQEGMGMARREGGGRVAELTAVGSSTGQGQGALPQGPAAQVVLRRRWSCRRT